MTSCARLARAYVRVMPPPPSLPCRCVTRVLCACRGGSGCGSCVCSRRHGSTHAAAAATRRGSLWQQQQQHRQQQQQQFQQQSQQSQSPGSGTVPHQCDANPYKSWSHLSHSWLLLMCAGCLGAGYLAGQTVDVDETQLQPSFSARAVMAAARQHFEFRPELAPTCLRVAFVLAARRAGVAATTADESCALAAGLTDVAGVLHYLATMYGTSMEDTAALAAVAAVQFLGGPCDEVVRTWRWGRNDVDTAPPRKQPQLPPSKTPTASAATAAAARTLFSPHAILHALGNLTDEECVALMACHSVGEFHDDVSGVDGLTHVGTRYTLSNAYYAFLLQHEKALRPWTVPRNEENKTVAQLPQTLLYTYDKSNMSSKKSSSSREGGGTDDGAGRNAQLSRRRARQCLVNRAEVDALLHNATWRAAVERFARDKAAWQATFQTAFTKMIDGNFARLRVYKEPHHDDDDGSSGSSSGSSSSDVGSKDAAVATATPHSMAAAATTVA